MVQMWWFMMIIHDSSPIWMCSLIIITIIKWLFTHSLWLFTQIIIFDGPNHQNQPFITEVIFNLGVICAAFNFATGLVMGEMAGAPQKERNGAEFFMGCYGLLLLISIFLMGGDFSVFVEGVYILDLVLRRLPLAI